MTVRKPTLGSVVCQTFESVDTPLERGSCVSLFNGTLDGGHEQPTDNEIGHDVRNKTRRGRSSGNTLRSSHNCPRVNFNDATTMLPFVTLHVHLCVHSTMDWSRRNGISGREIGHALEILFPSSKLLK